MPLTSSRTQLSSTQDSFNLCFVLVKLLEPPDVATVVGRDKPGCNTFICEGSNSDVATSLELTPMNKVRINLFDYPPKRETSDSIAKHPI